MRSPVTRVKQRIVLAGLTFALVVSGAVPLLGDHGAEAARKGKKANASGDLHAAEVQTFSNGGAIAINNDTTTQSPITVSGFVTPIADVDVTLNNLVSTDPEDIDVLLVGPGEQTAVILSDVGSTASDVTLTLDDQAANQVSSSGPLTTGTFQPTNFQSGEDFWFSPPAPPEPIASGSELGVFNGSDANGTWNLFIHDDTLGGTPGTIVGGWSLRITTANGVPTAGPESFQAQAGKPLAVAGPGVLGNDSDPDGDSLTAILAGQPKQGSLTLQANGSFTYRPKKKAKGFDSFTYLAQDADGLNDLATVDFQIKKKKKKKGKR